MTSGKSAAVSVGIDLRNVWVKIAEVNRSAAGR